MLTAQPPIYTIGQFEYDTDIPSLWWSQKKAVPQEDGLRMGGPFETVMQIERCNWKSRWIWVSVGGEVPVNAPSQLE